jgi:hypothetical protein
MAIGLERNAGAPARYHCHDQYAVVRAARHEYTQLIGVVITSVQSESAWLRKFDVSVTECFLDLSLHLMSGGVVLNCSVKFDGSGQYLGNC